MFETKGGAAGVGDSDHKSSHSGSEDYGSSYGQ